MSFVCRVDPSVRDNKLSGPIPDSLGNLVNLEELWLNANSIEGMYVGFRGFTIPLLLGCLWQTSPQLLTVTLGGVFSVMVVRRREFFY